MSNSTINMSEELRHYLLSNSLRESEILKSLREETLQQDMSVMQISPEQGQMMSLLLSLMQAESAIEIGVYTGYSSVIIGSALPESGKLIACDISDEWTSIARKYWQLAGIADKIDLRLAPALETLQQLIDDGQADQYDFVFIDADKANYINYYEKSLQLIRPGGLILVDNVLWSGSVIDKNDNEVDTVAIREFNTLLSRDNRVDISMVPIGDGVTLAVKR